PLLQPDRPGSCRADLPTFPFPFKLLRRRWLTSPYPNLAFLYGLCATFLEVLIGKLSKNFRLGLLVLLFAFFRKLRLYLSEVVLGRLFQVFDVFVAPSLPSSAGIGATLFVNAFWY